MAGTAEFSLQDIDRIIAEDEAAGLMVRVSQALGRGLARRNLTTHQLLNLFGEVRRIEMEWQQQQRDPEERLDSRIWRRLQLLKPRMAHQAARLRMLSTSRGYQESRARDDAMDPLIEALERAIDRVERNSDFQSRVRPGRRLRGWSPRSRFPKRQRSGLPSWSLVASSKSRRFRSPSKTSLSFVCERAPRFSPATSASC
jgi:CRISPR/Cas system CSM-associated protein Csm2 small subunit